MNFVDFTFLLMVLLPFMSLDSLENGIHEYESMNCTIILYNRSSALPLIQRGIYHHYKTREQYMINYITKVNKNL